MDQLLVESTASLAQSKSELDKFSAKACGPTGTLPVTPWYYRWKKWFLDKAFVTTSTSTK